MIYVTALFRSLGGVFANDGFSVNIVFFFFLKRVLIFQFNITFRQFHLRLAHTKKLRDVQKYKLPVRTYVLKVFLQIRALGKYSFFPSF